MIGCAVRRILGSIPTFLIVLTIVFLIVRILPGDPATAILGDRATPEAAAALRQRLGLDQSLAQQYIVFMGRSLSGDFGTSMVTNQPILTEVASVLPYTIELTAAALVLGVVTGVPAGVFAALYRGRALDLFIRLGSLLGLSFPVFVSGVFLLLAFAVHWTIFPVIGVGETAGVVDRLWRLVLPAATLGLVMAAYVTRVTRGAMLAVLNEDYMRTARSKGVPWRGVIWRHGLRNAGIPIVTVVGLYVGILIGNSVLTEIVFNRPGLGSLIVNALSDRDYTMLQGLMVIYTFLVVIVNIITDIAYGLIDPRVKTS